MIPHKSAIAARLYHGAISQSPLWSTRIAAALAWSTLAALPLCAQAQSPAPGQPVSATAKPIEERFSRTVAPGIELTTITRRDAKGPLQLFATRVNLHPENADVSYSLRLATAEYSVLKNASVSKIAKKENAVVAINGGYFAFGGAALGAVKIENEWIRLPLKNRTAMGITPGGRVLLEPLEAGARAIFGAPLAAREIAGSGNEPLFTGIAIDNLNGYAPENGVSLLTPRWGKTYALKPDEIALEIEAGVVRERIESGNADVRAGGWTLVARGVARANIASLSPGQSATWQVSAPAAWRRYTTILGAGPRLLKRGKIETTEALEEFRPDVLARGPRSAIGVDHTGQIWFLAVDGRGISYSVGLTIPELALEMQKLGCIEAICLDGGGSTALAINGIVVNRPSDGSERRVPNALVVTSDVIS